MLTTPSRRTVAPLRAGDHVVVIGAGPAGLTAAYLLTNAGVRTTVIEGDSIVGGISRTARYKNYRFDLGGHRFFTKMPQVQAVWDDLLGDKFISVRRLSRIHYQGHFFDYPLKAGNALRGLGPINALRILVSYLRWHFFPYPVEETFEQWVTNRFGKRLYEIFFKTYTEKVWGIPCTEIRADWAAQRIQGLSLAKAILTATSLQRRSTAIKTLIHEFRYPELGPGQMWEACRDRVERGGTPVLMAHCVERIECRDGRVETVVARTPGGEVAFAADHVITSAPLRSLVRALGPAVTAAGHAAAEGLRYRELLVVALVLDRAGLFPDNWLYIHTPGVRVGRIQNLNNWSPAMVPERDRTVLCFEYFCFSGDDLWTSADQELIALATRELDALGLAGGAAVLDGCVVRVPKAYPVYDAQYRDHLEAIRRDIDPIPNLHTVGRNGMHKYNNQDHSMLTAMMAVWNMQGARHDIWEVNTDFEYHEEQRFEPASAPGAAANS
ncbi:MAG: NAD(P)/FAD-dependent oxidoreductase [Acidobacteriota bacterium]